MKAMLYTQYGSPTDVLRLQEVTKPTPKDNDVLIKIHAASVNIADLYTVKGTPFIVRLMSGGILKPKNTFTGADVAGTIEAVGRTVTLFKPGDEVFGDLSGSGWGAYAEYVCAPENVLVSKPANITFEQAASVPLAGVTALKGLRDKVQIKAGQRVLIHGASGGVGTFAVQIAKAFGAEVTAVVSTKKLDMARSIGADHVIDYTKEDFTKNGQTYDVILAANGKRSLFDYRRALKNPGGAYIMTGGAMSQIFEALILGPWLSRGGKQTFGNIMSNPDTTDLGFLKDLLEAGKIVPVIDHCYPLSETAEALQYLESGRAQGKIVITMDQNTRAQ